MAENIRDRLNDPDSHLNFSWDKLGDIALGRPNLGGDVPVLVYRLFEYAISDVLAHRFGPETASDVTRQAGYLAGREFCKNALDIDLEPKEFLSELSKKLIDLKIGILRVERADLDEGKFTVTITEDLDCSGLPPTGELVCNYDEGFLEGVFNIYTKVTYKVREVDCWATGAKFCRFKGLQTN